MFSNHFKWYNAYFLLFFFVFNIFKIPGWKENIEDGQICVCASTKDIGEDHSIISKIRLDRVVTGASELILMAFLSFSS